MANAILQTNTTVTEKNSPIWAAYHQKDYARLTQLAKDSMVDFSVKTISTQKTIFHKCVVDNAGDRLKAILGGFTERTQPNSTIPKALNEQWNKKTPLFMAAESIYLYYKGTQRKMIEMLLSLGADREISCDGKRPVDVAPPATKNAFNPDLYTCFLNGEFNELLIRLKSVQRNSKGKSENSILSKIIDSSRNNSMLLAIKKGNETGQPEDLILEIIKALKSCGEDVNHENIYKENILVLAFIHGYRKIISYLIYEVNMPTSLNTPEGSIVHLAAQCDANDVDMLKLFLDRDPNSAKTKNKIGQTPLHFVKTTEAIDCLCLHGADVNDEDTEKHSPIQMAAMKDEKLADWMRLYDPNLKPEEKAAIIKKYDWVGPIKERIKSVTSASVDLIGSAAWKSAELAAQATAAIIVASFTAALQAAFEKKK